MIRKITAIYCIFIGLSMLSMWTILYLTNSIPELITEPARIIAHMVAEYLTAIALIVAGFGLLTLKKWGYQIYLLATGALIYTLIQSPGYYVQQEVLGYVIMFGVFLIAALGFLFATIMNRSWEK